MDIVFKLKITLGNEAMRSSRDVARALNRVASTLVERRLVEGEDEASGSIRDVNGNKVGEWEVTPEEDPHVDPLMIGV